MPETRKAFTTGRIPLEAEQYRLLQDAARIELSRRGLERDAVSFPEHIDPFAVLTREQIEQLLADFETKDETSKGGA